MIGIILAAGRGKRVSKAIKNKPKWSIKYRNKKLIDYQIQAFKRNKIDKIYIIGGYKSSLLPKEYKIIKNKEWNKTNSVYSLMKAKNFLKKETAIISYSDIYYNHNLIKKIIKSKHDLSLPFNLNWKKYWKKRFKNPLDDAESFLIDKNKKILEIGKKTKSILDIQGQFMGLIKLNPKSFKILYKIYSRLNKNTKMKIDTTTLLQKSISLKTKIYGIPSYDVWYEIDNKKDLKLFRKTNN